MPTQSPLFVAVVAAVGVISVAVAGFAMARTGAADAAEPPPEAVVTTSSTSSTSSTTSTTSTSTTSTTTSTSTTSTTTTTVPPTASTSPPPSTTSTTTTTVPPTASTSPPPPTSTSSTTSTTLPPPTTTTIVPYADAGAASTHVALVNQSRAGAGLPAVTPSATLAQAAVDWARSLADRGSLAHSNLGRIGGFSWKAENLGSGPPSAGAIHGQWMNSGGHRDNILSPKATHAGAGVWVDSSGRAWHVLVLGG